MLVFVDAVLCTQNKSSRSRTMSKTVLLEVKNRLGYLTINRPSALNALSSEVLKDLNLALDQIEASEDIRVVIVTGQGEKAFVAGADIKEMDQMSPIQAHEYMTYANDTFTRLSELTQPTISVLNGYALGGGLELALSTDIRIGYDKTMVGFPEVGSELPLKNAIRLETEAEALLFSTEDKVEGMRAFVEKRKAVFQHK